MITAYRRKTVKHIRKRLALILALCLLAVLPLTAAAESEYDQHIIGVWEVYQVYDADTGNCQEVLPGASCLIVNADGTASWMVGSDTYSAKWVYRRSDDTGYWYRFAMTNAEGTVSLNLVYVTCESDYLGDVILCTGNTLTAFRKV